MVSESKKYAHKLPAMSSGAKQSTQEVPTKHSHRKGFVGEFLISIVAHIIAPLVLAVASTAWLVFVKDPSVPQWPFLIFVILTITFAYLSLISLQFFFHNEFVLPRRANFHLAFFAILVVTVTAPLAITLSFTTTRANELLSKIQKAENELKNEQEVQKAADSKRIQLFVGVTDSITKLLQKENIDNTDLRDILNYCIESISLNKPQVHDLRVTFVHLDRTGNFLVVPKQGYAGTGFDQDITGLYFNVSPRNPDVESEEQFRDRLGVAGWSYITGKAILDDDVQTMTTGEEHHYKQYVASQKVQPDRSMICVGIPDLDGGKPNRYVGVLSISSMTPRVFTQNDLAVARFFATLLGKFKTPVELPPAVLEAERNNHGT